MRKNVYYPGYGYATEWQNGEGIMSDVWSTITNLLTAKETRDAAAEIAKTAVKSTAKSVAKSGGGKLGKKNSIKLLITKQIM